MSFDHPALTLSMRDVAFASGAGARRLWELRRHGLALSADRFSRPPGQHAKFAEADAVAVLILESVIRAGNTPERALHLCGPVLALLGGAWMDSRAEDLAAAFRNLRLQVPCTTTEVRLDEIARAVAIRIETLHTIRQQSQ